MVEIADSHVIEFGNYCFALGALNFGLDCFRGLTVSN
jgi:hypothetical protein